MRDGAGYSRSSKVVWKGSGIVCEARYCGTCGNRCGRGIVGRDESYRYEGRLEAKESGAVYLLGTF